MFTRSRRAIRLQAPAQPVVKLSRLLGAFGDEALNFLGFESNVMTQSDRWECAEAGLLSDPRRRNQWRKLSPQRQTQSRSARRSCQTRQALNRPTRGRIPPRAPPDQNPPGGSVLIRRPSVQVGQFSTGVDKRGPIEAHYYLSPAPCVSDFRAHRSAAPLKPRLGAQSRGSGRGDFRAHRSAAPLKLSAASTRQLALALPNFRHRRPFE